MGSGFAKQKKQAKMFQEQMQKMQTQMKTTEVEGSAGNGLVTIKMNGENVLLSIKIKPECVDKDDIEGLEDLIKAAYKDAQNKLQKQSPSLSDMSGLGDLEALKGFL